MPYLKIGYFRVSSNAHACAHSGWGQHLSTAKMRHGAFSPVTHISHARDLSHGLGFLLCQGQDWCGWDTPASCAFMPKLPGKAREAGKRRRNARSVGKGEGEHRKSRKNDSEGASEEGRSDTQPESSSREPARESQPEKGAIQLEITEKRASEDTAHVRETA